MGTLDDFEVVPVSETLCCKETSKYAELFDRAVECKAGEALAKRCGSKQEAYRLAASLRENVKRWGKRRNPKWARIKVFSRGDTVYMHDAKETTK